MASSNPNPEQWSPATLALLEALAQREIIRRDEDTDPHQLGDVLSWDDWISREYYSGPFSRILYPFWRKEIGDFIANQQSEWVITGSKGGGKTTAAEAFTAYKIYYLSRFEYPQRLFGLSEVTSLVFVYLSVSTAKAKIAGFGEMREYIDHIPYFRDEFKRDMNNNLMLLFPNRVVVIPGSGAAQTDLSLNTIGVLLDETNFYKAGGGGNIGDLASAQRIYTDTNTRRKSRFVVQGIDYSFTLLVSSATHDQSFTQTRIKEAELSGEPQKVTQTCGWITNPEKYTTQRSVIFKGDDKREPRIIHGIDDYIDTAVDFEQDNSWLFSMLREGETPLSIYNKLPLSSQSRFLLVPTEVLPAFRTNIYAALSDLAGISIAPSGKLYTSGPNWMATCKAGTAVGLRHPFTKEELQITINSPQQVMDFFIPEILFAPPDFKTFRRHPNALRFIHVDSSTTTDKTGVAMTHLAGIANDPLTGLPLPTVEEDFVLRISNTQSPDQIDLSKVLAFFFYLRNVHQVKFGKITYDSEASEMPLQQMMKNHIPAGRLSVERDGPWLDFVELLNGGRFVQYYNEYFKKEFFMLNWDRGTHSVDHPPSGTKDVSDAVIGAVYNCLTGTVTGESRPTEEIAGQIIIPNQPKDILHAETSWLCGDYERKHGKISRGQ